jgi:hypothetical protein
MKISEKKWAFLIIASSIMFLFILLAPGFHEAFFPIDDHGLFNQAYLKNPWHWSSLKALLTPGNSADYYPIRDMSTWLDWSLAKNLRVDTTIPQIQNFVWLVGTAILLFLLLNQISQKYLVNSLVTSAWLLHPFHQESLHWISARKDLMSWFFMLASSLVFIKLIQKPRVKFLFSICILFLLGLLSKAGFLAVPFAVLAWLLFEKYRNDKRHHALVWTTVVCSCGIALLMVLVNYWNYTASNYMQMTEEPWVRFLSVLAAFGRNVIGSIVPFYNAVDVEPWGGWYLFNRQFVLFGGLALLSLLGLTVFSFKKERSEWRLFILLIFAVLVMTPGFNPKHRNYYSIRYFEPVFFLVSVWISTFLQNRKWSIGIAALVLAFVGGTAFYDSPNWESNYAIMKKSNMINPEDPSIRSMLLFELHNLDTWGRLNKSEQENFRRLYQANLQECIFSKSVSGRCLTFLVRVNPLMKKFNRSVEEQDKIREIALKNIFSIKSQIFSEVAKSQLAFTLFHSKLNNGVLNKELLRDYFAGQTSLTDDYSRVRFLLLQCLDNGSLVSQATYQQWIREYVIDPEEVAEFISQMQNEKLRHQIQGCFGTQKGL